MFGKIKKWLKDREETYKRIILNRESVNCPYCNENYSPDLIYDNTTKTMDLISNEEKMSSTRNRYVKCFSCDRIFGIEENYYYSVGVMFHRNSFAIE